MAGWSTRRWLVAQWVGACIAFAWSGLAGAEAPAAPARTAPATAAAAAGHGFLWKVEDGPRLAYLYGTVHVGKASFFPLGPMPMEALQRSAVIALEADITDTQKASVLMQQRALYAEPQGLRPRLSAEVDARLLAVCRQLGLPTDGIYRFKPFTLATTLSVLDSRRLGYDPAYATETFLASYARQAKKPLVEVEGLEAQFDLFDRMPEADGLAMLDESLTEIQSGRNAAELDALAGAWLRADARALERYAEDAFGRPGRAYAYLKTELIDRRNDDMARKLEGYLRSGQVHFVAVGSLHLVGASGLPAQMARRGYRVTRLLPGGE